ncbi:hypothetical protein KIN10_05090, partial [Vibrio cholerae]|nr:hypothetical protein [Vibrio cholerae]
DSVQQAPPSVVRPWLLLLFQDVVAVLLLTLVPVFAGSSDQAWYWALPLTLGKTVVLFVGLLFASRWLLPRLFREVAASHSVELLRVAHEFEQ